ncbi:MAG TPA: dCTP deaminase [Phycisphaerales bacterium]|nr:dCTP deaminase [Phycisphaerales bacterium]HMP36872.1 dCTP deaminase [Phycisphaerales bacterium]
MGVLCDTQIRELVGIEPFEEGRRRPGVISYGVSSYGYDVRLGTRFKIFTNATTGGAAVIDPKSFNPELFISVDTAETGRDHIIIPPNSFALAETVESFVIPRDVLAICVGKSTYARCGIIVNVTPLEPEWRGRVTIEISNTTPLPAKIYANEGIAQMVFVKADRVCATSYADKRGKYQDQPGLTLPAVDSEDASPGREGQRAAGSPAPEERSAGDPAFRPGGQDRLPAVSVPMHALGAGA